MNYTCDVANSHWTARGGSGELGPVRSCRSHRARGRYHLAEVCAPPRATSWTSPHLVLWLTHLVNWLQPRRAVPRGAARCSEVARGGSRRRQYTTRRHPTSSPRAKFSKYLEILPRRGDLERLLSRRSRGLPRGGWRGGRGGRDLTSRHSASWLQPIYEVCQPKHEVWRGPRRGATTPARCGRPLARCERRARARCLDVVGVVRLWPIK